MRLLVSDSGDKMINLGQRTVFDRRPVFNFQCTTMLFPPRQGFKSGGGGKERTTACLKLNGGGWYNVHLTAY